MKVRNKARLVARAAKHKAMDRFISFSYIDSFYEGRYCGVKEDQKFKGCLIGCLGMPTTPEAIDKRLRKRAYSDTNLVRWVEEEFGVCRALQRAGEAFLIVLPDDSNARLGGFTERFCKALPEDRDITNELVLRWCESRPGVCGEVDNGWRGQEDFEIDVFSDWKRELEAFIDWLRRGAPEPRKARTAR